MSYSPTMMRWLQQDPMGYVDGASLCAISNANPLKYVDPLGLWRIDGDYAVAEDGDTLSALATTVFGDAKRIGQLGYTGDPNKIFADRTKINLGYIIQPHAKTLERFKGLMDNLKSFLIVEAASCNCSPKYEEQLKQFEELLGTTLTSVANAPKQASLIGRLGIGVTLGGSAMAFGGLSVSAVGSAGKNFFLGDVTNTLKDLPKGSTARVIQIGGTTLTVLGALTDAASGAINVREGKYADAAGDFSMAGAGAFSLAFPPLGAGVAAVGVFRLAWNYIYDRQAQAANAHACRFAQDAFDIVYAKVKELQPSVGAAITFFGKFN